MKYSRYRITSKYEKVLCISKRNSELSRILLGTSNFFTPNAEELKNGLTIDGNTKKVIKIAFGIEPPPVEKEEKGKGKKGKGKGKKDKGKGKKDKGKKGKDKKKKGSSKSSKGKGKGEPSGPQKWYLAKYNVMLGNSTFLKDFIVMGMFNN